MSLTELASTFTNNILPILLISLSGFLLGRTLPVDSRTVGRIVFYILSPLLVFDLLVHTELDLSQTLTMIVYTVAAISVTGAAAWLLGISLRLTRPVLLAVVLTSAFGNTGNYGLPLVKFAFGDEALAAATLCYTTTAILFHLAGTLIASMGRTDLRSSLLGLLKLPILYAVLLAAIVKWFDWSLPLPLARTITIAANGAIPMMLVLLGLELNRIQWTHDRRAVGAGLLSKLLLGPALGIAIAALLGLQGAVRQGAVIQAAMPAAVVNTVVASEFDLEPSLVTTMVFAGTLLSPFTLTPLLVLLAGS